MNIRSPIVGTCQKHAKAPNWLCGSFGEWGRAATTAALPPTGRPAPSERHCPIVLRGASRNATPFGPGHPLGLFRSSRRTGVLIIDDRAISPIPTRHVLQYA